MKIMAAVMVSSTGEGWVEVLFEEEEGW